MAAYWILPPVGQFAIASPVDRLGLVIFTGMGLFMSVVAELYRRNRDKAAAYDREAALRESQARLATFAEATFEGIVESEAGRIVDCNEQFARMMGYSVAELRGMEIASLIAPEDRDRVMANIRQGRESVIEHAMLRKDGTRIVVEAHGRPVSPGSARRHTAIRDITERKRAEDQFRVTLESIGDGFFACDADWRFVYVNAPAERILGVRREEVLGKSHWEVFPLTLGTALEREYRRAAGGEIRDFENFYEPWQRWFHNRCFPREGGGMSIYFEDITERKRAEEELAESRERLQLALASSGMALFDWDIVKNKRTWGEGVHRLLGTTPESFTGNAEEFFQVIHPDDRIAVRAALTKAIDTTVYETEYRAVWPDGSVRHIAARGSVHRDREAGPFA